MALVSGAVTMAIRSMLTSRSYRRRHQRKKPTAVTESRVTIQSRGRQGFSRGSARTEAAHSRAIQAKRETSPARSAGVRRLSHRTRSPGSNTRLPVRFSTTRRFCLASPKRGSRARAR